MIHSQERALSQVPTVIMLFALAAFALQIVVHHQFEKVSNPEYEPLPPPLGQETYRHLSMGSPQLLSYWLNIKLQLHDTQVGRYFNYRRMNYDRLVRWLTEISDLNPLSEYSMLMASRMYSQVNDKEKLRKILQFIVSRFNDDPELHWRRLAEASVIARHKLEDLDLALDMARMLASQPRDAAIPFWARDLKFLVLAEMTEYEAAITIIRALLASNSISDPDELRFLKEKLSEFQQSLLDSRQNHTGDSK